MAEEIERNDIQIWSDILKLMLDGVMTHIGLFEFFNLKEIHGMAAMHKHHAEEEFNSYLHVTGDYINSYNKVATMSNVAQPIINIAGTTKEEMMYKGLEYYEKWEKGVYDHLKKYKTELHDGKEHVDYLIDDVKKELKCIRLMMNDIDDCKYEELEAWLIKKWGD